MRTLAFFFWMNNTLVFYKSSLPCSSWMEKFELVCHWTTVHELGTAACVACTVCAGASMSAIARDRGPASASLSQGSSSWTTSQGSPRTTPAGGGDGVKPGIGGKGINGAGGGWNGFRISGGGWKGFGGRSGGTTKITSNCHVQFDTCTVLYTCQTVWHVHFDTRETRVRCESY
jgi:hypothetical protein